MAPNGFPTSSDDVFATDQFLLEEETDVEVVTSGGVRIPAHSNILALASPVLGSVLKQQQVIPILGVPCGAVSAFIRYLYSYSTPRWCSPHEDESIELEKYGIHLLALSHVYAVQQLKQSCIRSLTHRLTVDNVIDLLQLARLCDAPDLRLKCLKLVSTKFKAVEKTEGWKFLHNNDPWLELDILQFIDESESRRKRNKRHREEQCVYLQLSEAMDCLVHIWTEGCTSVGPSYHRQPTSTATNKKPCVNFSTCHGLQLLIKHFAACDKRGIGEVCCQCKRLMQLLRLHACLCDQPRLCRVPLCRQYKMKMQTRGENHEAQDGNNNKWRLLAKKVVVARAASALSAAATKRKRDNSQQQRNHEHQLRSINHHRLQSLRLCQREATQMSIIPPV